MTNAHRILLVLGTRPEAIKLAPVALALGADPRFSVSVCSSGQHRDMVRPVCDLFGLDIDHDLDLMMPGLMPWWELALVGPPASLLAAFLYFRAVEVPIRHFRSRRSRPASAERDGRLMVSQQMLPA